MTDAMPVGERPQLAPPVVETGLFGWMRKNLFSRWGKGITTVVLALGIGSLVTFLLMFGEINIPLGLILFVALAAGGLGMILRGALASPAEINGWRALAAIAALGLVLRLAGVLPSWSLSIAPLPYVET